MAQIAVMGAGIFGLASAWAMARRGARVRVIEASRIGAGASGGVVGALAPHVVMAAVLFVMFRHRLAIASPWRRRAA